MHTAIHTTQSGASYYDRIGDATGNEITSGLNTVDGCMNVTIIYIRNHPHEAFNGSILHAFNPIYSIHVYRSRITELFKRGFLTMLPEKVLSPFGKMEHLYELKNKPALIQKRVYVQCDLQFTN